MLRRIVVPLLFLCLALPATAQITIAQISDTHLGLKRTPQAAGNLRRVVDMVNQHPPDAVIVSGDIGETPQAWKEAREILGKVKAPVYYIPGNHDDSANTVDRYLSVFGKNYYSFKVKNATFLALDSQLLGNFDVFESRQIMPLSAIGQAQSAKMLDWLGRQIDELQEQSAQTRGGAAAEPGLVFVVQHVPISRNGDFPPDAKPYWTVQEPYRSRELELLRRLGVKHVFAGHWHAAMVFQAEGITYHLAPATSWSPFDYPLGFAVHTITPAGDVKTEFVNFR